MHGQALRTWLMAVEPPDTMLMRRRERNKMVTQSRCKTNRISSNALPVSL